MRSLALCILGLATLPSPGAAQTIRHVDLYGLRTVPESRVLEALGFGVGDELPVDRDAACERLRAIEGIVDARILVMAIPGREHLLVGVLEDGAPTLSLREPPGGEDRLPAEWTVAYETAMELGYEGMMRGAGGEERAEGHSFSTYAPAREQEQVLFDAVRSDPELVRRVLRESADELHRTVAAKAIAYLPDKDAVVPELVFAATDPSSSVRNNAVRALSVLAEWASGQPDFQVEIDVTPFLPMLESLEWTDRNKGSVLLYRLSEGRDPELLDALRSSSIPALTEMALWHSEGHAFPSVAMLGRLAGSSEEELRRRDGEAREAGDDAHRAWIAELAKAAARGH